MKIFKKILAGVVSAAVIVSALAVPTAALSSTMTHKYDSGTLTASNGKVYCSYSTDTGASETQAIATASSTRVLTWHVTIYSKGHIAGGPMAYKSNEDAISGTSISVSVNNIVQYEGKERAMTIIGADGSYRLNAKTTIITHVGY